MVSINPLITLVVVILTPISLFVASFIAKKTYVMFKHQSETRGELTTLTDEMLGNMKVVQAFGYQSEAQERFEKINNKLAGYSLKATFLLIHYQSSHPLCKQPGLCSSWHYRCLCCHSRFYDSWTAYQLFKLCKSVYQAV